MEVLKNVSYDFCTHCGESKTQRKWFLDEKRGGLLDENRVNNKENKNNRAVLCFIFLLMI